MFERLEDEVDRLARNIDVRLERIDIATARYHDLCYIKNIKMMDLYHQNIDIDGDNTE
jgi:hypothetical protein